MKDDGLSKTDVAWEDAVSPSLLDTENEPTATIDLHNLFTRDVTSSGSFDIRGGIWATTFGKLIQALPIPAVLVDRSKTVMAANQACGRISHEYERIVDMRFHRLFRDPNAAKRALSILDEIIITRKPQVIEAILQIGRNSIWGRMTFRSIRIVSERHILILIEDLTAEKKRLLSEKLHTKALEEEITRRESAEDELRQAQEMLEDRVKARTAELMRSNKELKCEIEERRRTQEKLTLANRIIEGCNEAIIFTDSNRMIIDVNEAFCRQCGFSKEDLLGRNPRILKSGKHGDEFYQEMWDALLATGLWEGEIWGRRKNGEFYPKLLSVSALKDASGTVTHYVGFSSDIAKIKQTEEKLRQLSHFDQLTGLANRILLRDRLERAIVQSRQTDLPVALMLLDLDRFKEINDTFGYPAGDKVLKTVAKLLSDRVKETDTVGRLGGDEFAVILPELRNLHEVEATAKRIMNSLENWVHTDDGKVFVSTCMGIAMYPSDASDVDKLMQNADTALYRAKGRGRNSFQFFSEEMNRELVDKMELELALRAALDSDEFLLYYQPIVDFDTGSVSSAEVLLRWRHPKRGWIPPEKIISLGEESGLIHRIGEWALHHACLQSRRWRKNGFPPLRLAVNVSGHQLNHSGFVPGIIRILKDTGLEPPWLELELTESVAMSNPARTQEAFRELRAYGIKISVDDFGTGYSSLSYLKRLEVDRLKVDRSFVHDIGSHPANRAIVAAIVAMGHSLNLRIVAEGIETRDQLELLWSLNCDEWQGFLFSRPAPAEQFNALVRDGRKAPHFKSH